MRKTIAAVLLLALGLTSRVVAQQQSNVARGFAPEKLYDFGGIDSVNLFNGGLTLTVPIGGSYPVNGTLSYSLSLVYNSKIWEYKDRYTQSQTYVQAFPQAGANAGLGWTLSLGELLPPSSPRNESLLWVYVGSDGAQHHFYDSVVPGQTIHPGICYTRDSSYLRLKGVGGCSNNANGTLASIEFPDGTRHSFSRASGGSSVPFKLFEIRDRFENVVTVSYLTGPERWVLTDPHRSQTITFGGSPSWGNKVVTRVDLASAGGTATYTFNYSDTYISRSCDDNDPQTDDNPVTAHPIDELKASLLSSVVLPDGSSYTMDSYITACGAPAGADGPGVLTQLTLPTRGKIGYQYSEWAFVQRLVRQEDVRIWVDGYGLQTAVSSKTAYDAAGNHLGTWTYAATSGTGPNYERRILVTTPLGDQTVNWFVENDNAVEYGLPMKKTTGDGSGRFLSQEIYDGPVTSGLKRRSTYLRYDQDAHTTGTAENRNRRVGSQRTTYHDDGDNWAVTDYSNFDGVGHYRQSTTSGSFAAGNLRSQTIDYPGLPAGWNPWILDVFWGNYVSDGSTATQYLSCFDSYGTGALKRRRFLRLPGALDPADVLVEYVHDVNGNVISERYYGGDTNPIPAGDFCAMTLPASTYQIDNTYQYGALKTTKHIGPGITFYDVDNTLNAATGLPVTSRDSALVATTYEYDTLNRLTWVKPAQDAWTNYVYYRAIGTGSASVNIRRYPNGSASGPLTDEQVEFDPFGRVYREKRRTPSGIWAKRTTFYNAMGWKTDVSEWQQDGQPQTSFTKYQNHDPFGRPTSIRPPDGAAHDVGLSYAGVRSTTRTTKVATGVAGAETTSTTTEIYDRQGRLYQVKEASGAGGAVVTTTYGYHAGGQLKSVSTPSGSTQNRSFNYDGRGFLNSECHPEKGVSGNGCVAYSLYDARGHAGRKVDGASSLRFFYDAAERLTQVNDDAAGLPMKVFTYGTGTSAADRSRGKVKAAARYNYVVSPPMNATVLITETYTYGGRQGRVSQRDTQNNVAGANRELFRQTFTWNDLGDLASQIYPDCAAVCPPSSPRTVSYSYQDGRLTSVPGYANALTYHLNGMLSTLTHSNGVVFSQIPDPFGMSRPQSLTASRAGTLWLSGAYAYDGAGNVKQIGSGYFQYDGVSRLLSGQVNTAPTGAASLRIQSATFDAFGNIQTLTTDGSQLTTTTSGATNRLTSAGYDGDGNTRFWNGATYEYDPMGMMKRMVNGGENWIYMYTADDERFWSFRAVNGGGSIWTLRGLDKKVLRTYEAHTSWSTYQDYIYREGQLLAGFRSSGEQRHFDLDHLGTPRLVTDWGGNFTSFHSYFPFGQEALPLGATAQGSERMRFTGHERDLAAVTAPVGGNAQADDLDYMHKRHESPLTGRFLTIDPARGAQKSPQTWNRYSYVSGNPVKYTDPDGRFGLLMLAEILSTGYDGYQAIQAVRDPYKSAFEKVATVGLAAASAGLPLGGYSALGGRLGSLADEAGRGWKVGQSITNLTARGRIPSWSAVRRRFWKNEALFNPDVYDAANLARMRQRGLAPQRVNDLTGAMESMELHHTPAVRDGGHFEFTPLWPDDHAAVDPFRRLGNQGNH